MEPKIRKQIAETVKRRLTILLGFLIAILLGVILKIGELWSPGWILGHRTQIAGILLLAIISWILLSPIMIEASSNPDLSPGPAKTQRVLD